LTVKTSSYQAALWYQNTQIWVHILIDHVAASIYVTSSVQSHGAYGLVVVHDIGCTVLHGALVGVNHMMLSDDTLHGRVHQSSNPTPHAMAVYM
jgi:hypothetical protein